jgi:transposase-like protein
MTIEVLRERGVSQRAIARQLGVHENVVRYRLRRLAAGALDRRADKVSSVAPLAAAVAHWMDSVAVSQSRLSGIGLYSDLLPVACASLYQIK